MAGGGKRADGVVDYIIGVMIFVNTQCQKYGGRGMCGCQKPIQSHIRTAGALCTSQVKGERISPNI
jgi:hypothetical protein